MCGAIFVTQQTFTVHDSLNCIKNLFNAKLRFQYMVRYATREWTKEDVDVLIDTTIDGGCRLIVHNDEVNTFDWVIKALIEVCRHTPEQAEQCTLIIHFKGKCAVKEGSEEELKPMKDAIIERGIGATIEHDG